MADTAIDKVEFRLLGLLQNGFPLSKEPFSDIGMKLAMTGEDVIHHINNLKNKGIVRQISPVLDARKIGYQSTLVAMKVPKQGIGQVERFLDGHSGVSHAYERDHEYNLWFTLSIPVNMDIQAELQNISTNIGADSAFDLPAITVFKLRTNFGFDEGSYAMADMSKVNNLTERIQLSEIERNVINALQEDLPLVFSPFKIIADKLELSVDSLLNTCLALQNKGVIRRYGASINHYKAGYNANAMTCWYVPQEGLKAFAAKVTSLSQVSHCYERRTNSFWRHNLFVMIHGQTKGACCDIVNKISSESEINDLVVLFSTKEFKKTRIRYPV